MQIAEFLLTLHHLVKITCQLYDFPVCLVGAEQYVKSSQFPHLFTALWLTWKAEIGCCLASQFFLRDFT